MGITSLLRFGKGDAPAIVQTKQGKVEGVKRGDTKVYVFRGIPFATPPVGALRFKKSVPHPGWEGVRACKEFGKTAVQNLSIVVLVFLPKFVAALVWGGLWLTGSNPVDNYHPKRPMSLPGTCSEADCLNLNVESPMLPGDESDQNNGNGPAPKKMAKGLLPVMVWIHGGAFQLGASSQYLYQPTESFLARQNVVVVSINYRLGVLGFCKVEGGDYNCGMWDQVAALRWVQENIAAFGGDPNNVTIFGESAGGMSCGFLSATKFAGQLFHRVVLQSGTMQTGLTRDEAGWLAEETARALEIPSCSLATMGSTSAAALLAAQNLVIRGNRCGGMPYQPVVDGDLLEDRIVSRWKAGSAKDLDFLISYTRHEELLFLKIFNKKYVSDSEEKLLKRITFNLSPPVMDVPEYQTAAQLALDEIKAWEGGATPPTHADYWTYKAIDFCSMLKFAIPSHFAANTLVKAPGRSKSVYLCRFDVHSPLMNGACHAIDLPYVFGGVKAMSGAMCPADVRANEALSCAVTRAWANFAKTGDPNTCSEDKKDDLHVLPIWPVLSPAEAHQTMILDVPLSSCRIQEVALHQVFPELWKMTVENARALWFHRPPPSGSDTEKTIQSNL
ncbi:carboxylesterase [Nannochloropsis oceanica]